MSGGRYSLDYVCRRYGVPAKRGMRVVADGESGIITCGDGQYLRIRLDSEKRSGRWHPTWHIDYGDGIDYGESFGVTGEAVAEIAGEQP